MRQANLARQLRERPFRPLRLLLSNGTVHEIRHPELAMVGRSTVILGSPSSEEAPPAMEDYVMVSLLHIVQVEPISAAIPPATSSSSAP